MLLEIGGNRMQDSALGRDLCHRVRGRLVDLLRISTLSPVEQAQAGTVLGKRGDPRVEVLDPLQIDWCEVKAGSFKMGNQLDIYLIPYTISRYPVTNAQFHAFVDADCYTIADYWQAAVQAGYWTRGRFRGFLDTEGRGAPSDYGEPYHLANHPVVGITWDEALAFARWLTVQMHTGGTLPTSWGVRLPNEPEWEKAARGADSCDYPWPGDLTVNHANFDETGIGTTNAVGCFPAGASPYGVEEMSGNVWEWTRSIYGDLPPYPAGGPEKEKRENLDSGAGRVLRGGSFYESSESVRCAARSRYSPGLGFGRYYGFQVCAAPISPGR